MQKAQANLLQLYRCTVKIPSARLLALAALDVVSHGERGEKGESRVKGNSYLDISRPTELYRAAIKRTNPFFIASAKKSQVGKFIAKLAVTTFPRELAVKCLGSDSLSRGELYSRG